MEEIVTFDDWRIAMNDGETLILITKKSCQECIEVESYLELNNYHVKEFIVKKISLDNPESQKLSNELKWIKKEVDIIPFWTLISSGVRISSIRGGIKDVKRLITSYQENRFQED
tara:strand:- start:4037 stop:4381 length:345 start_codon:yes stop_codon:yes gene_type:complete